MFHGLASMGSAWKVKFNLIICFWFWKPKQIWKYERMHQTFFWVFLTKIFAFFGERLQAGREPVWTLNDESKWPSRARQQWNHWWWSIKLIDLWPLSVLAPHERIVPFVLTINLNWNSFGPMAWWWANGQWLKEGQKENHFFYFRAFSVQLDTESFQLL